MPDGSALNNIAEFGPNAVIRIKFRRDALPQDDLRRALVGPALFHVSRWAASLKRPRQVNAKL
jgi:hypothetical protein